MKGEIDLISQFKQNAKMSLKGNWGNAIVVFLGIYFLGGMINSIPQYFVMPSFMKSIDELQYIDEGNISEILTIFAFSFTVLIISSVVISILVISVLQLGYQRFSINLAKNDVADTDLIFDGFKKHYWINVKAILWVVFYSFLWQVPSLLFYGLGIYFAFLESELTIVFMAIGGLTSLFAIFKILKYTLVPYLLMDDDVSFNTANEYVVESVRIMQDNVFELILLGFSFILWVVFIAITFGFGALYVGPYMQQSYTNFYLHHKEVKNIAYQ